MAGKFDKDTLGILRKTDEVRIRPGKSTRRGIIIWVVVAGDEVFVRSVRGPGGKWFAATSAAGQATLEFDGRLVPVAATVVKDAKTIAAVSAEFLAKYATSPYAQSIVKPETLPTTLRLDPR